MFKTTNQIVLHSKQNPSSLDWHKNLTNMNPTSMWGCRSEVWGQWTVAKTSTNPCAPQIGCGNHRLRTQNLWKNNVKMRQLLQQPSNFFHPFPPTKHILSSPNQLSWIRWFLDAWNQPWHQNAAPLAKFAAHFSKIYLAQVAVLQCFAPQVCESWWLNGSKLVSSRVRPT